MAAAVRDGGQGGDGGHSGGIFGWLHYFWDIRKSEPVKNVFVIDGSPQKLANCASYELSDLFNSTLIEKQGAYYILVGYKGFGYPYDLGEVVFKQSNGNGTIIELRI